MSGALAATGKYFRPALLAVLLLWPAPGRSDERALRDARELVSAGLATEALQVLERVRLDEASPAAAERARLQGLALFSLGEDAAARAALVQAIAGGRGGPEVLARLAEIDRRAGRSDLAATALAWTAMLAPDVADWRQAEAELRLEAGQTGAALQIADQLLAARPQDPEPWLGAGRIRLQAERHRDALVAFETAWWLGATAATLPQLIAELWLREGDAWQALRWYDRAPDADAHRLRRAELAWQAGDAALAQALLEEIADDAPAALLRGRIARAQGDAGGARAAFLAAARQLTLPVDVELYLAAEAYNRARWAEAATRLDAVYGRAPAQLDDPNMLRFHVLALARSGRPVAARERLAAHLARHGPDPRIRDWLGELAEIAGR